MIFVVESLIFVLESLFLFLKSLLFSPDFLWNHYFCFGIVTFFVEIIIFLNIFSLKSRCRITILALKSLFFSEFFLSNHYFFRWNHYFCFGITIFCLGITFFLTIFSLKSLFLFLKSHFFLLFFPWNHFFAHYFVFKIVPRCLVWSPISYKIIIFTNSRCGLQVQLLNLFDFTKFMVN